MRFETQTNLYGDAPLLQKLTSHDTQFSVVQGKISAMITESELAELVSGGKTMYSAMNSIAIDVNGVHADMSRMNTTIGENSGQIETLNTQMATYSATVNGISGEISATKIALGGVETLQACFEASASEILQSVSRTYATQTDVEDLLVDTVYQFNKNTSASVPPAESDSGWSATSPVREEGKYIWMRAERTFKNGEVTHTTPVCITGADGRNGIDGQDGAPGQQGPAGQPGAAGAPGVDGKDGKDGKDGASISDVVPQYYLSTSNTTIAGGTWGTTIPSYVTGRYYWTRELVTRTDSTTFYTDPRLDAQLNNFESRLYTAEQKITDSAIVQTVTSSKAWGQVVTKGSVILEINNEASQYSIDADKINLSGFISANGTFTIDENGYLRADGGTIGGWTLSDNKIYSGSSSYVILNPMQTGLSVAVFAVGAKRLTNVPSEMKADNVPFYITSSGDVYASSMHLTGTVVSEIPGSVSAFNYKLYLGVSGFFTASDSNINRKGVQISSKSIGFYSFDHSGEELGYIGSSYDSSTGKTKFLIGAKAANTNSLVIGTAAKQESAVITHEPYITINDSSSGMIRFNKYIQTNLYVQDSMATNAQRGFLSYRRMSLYKDISQTTGQSIWIDSAVENDTSIIRNRVVGGSVAQGPAVRIWANGTNNNRNFVEISSGGIDVYVYSTMSSGKPMYNGTRVMSFAV